MTPEGIDLRERVGREGFGSEGCHRWFLVHARPRREDIAEEHLQRQGFETFLPRAVRTIRHARKARTVLKAYFPGYLFVAFDPWRDRWGPINSTIGVVRLVMAKDKPLPTPADLVPTLREACDDEGVLRLDDALRFGQRVRVLAGPLADHLGTIERLGPADRVRVLVALMGASVPVSIARDHVAVV